MELGGQIVSSRVQEARERGRGGGKRPAGGQQINQVRKEPKTLQEEGAAGMNNLEVPKDRGVLTNRTN